VEPRASTHKLVFLFGIPITSPGTVNVIPAGSALPPVINGNNVEVTLSGIADNSRVTVALANINGVGANVAASIGFLVGDNDGSRSVDATDVSAIKALSGQAADNGNFRADLDLSGAITSSDILRAKGRLGLTIP
jgi:hypothetical protein